MARYQIILAYDGTDFSGFQRQKNKRTVQGSVEKALGSLGWEEASLLAAGRTDAGVHARGQVIAFDLDWRHPEEDLLLALNAGLPQDVAARGIQAVAEDFHPRFDAIAREYRYEILYDTWRHPLMERYAWRQWPALDFDNLQRAAKLLNGNHNFRAFGSPPRPGGTGVREVMKAVWRESKTGIRFEIAANGFLYHMVRRLVQVQVGVGRGKYPEDILLDMLDSQKANLAQGMAPPQGLCLEKVYYPGMSETEILKTPGTA